MKIETWLSKQFEEEMQKTLVEYLRAKFAALEDKEEKEVGWKETYPLGETFKQLLTKPTHGKEGYLRARNLLVLNKDMSASGNWKSLAAYFEKIREIIVLKESHSLRKKLIEFLYTHILKDAIDVKKSQEKKLKKHQHLL